MSSKGKSGKHRSSGSGYTAGGRPPRAKAGNGKRSTAGGKGKPGKKALFLDRDGTIIIEKDHLGDPEAVELIPGSAGAIRDALKAGFMILVVTNQSGIGRGLFTEDDMHSVNKRVRGLVARAGGAIHGFYFCPHHPEEARGAYRIRCDCRKPATGMLKQAGRDFGVDLGASVIVGDKASDIHMGKRAGLKTILVLTGYGRSESAKPGIVPDHVADDLRGAVDWLLDGGRRAG
jgi:D-glycero-D-manno-heptose 1,7-bisphosphate phosphatase